MIESAVTAAVAAAALFGVWRLRSAMAPRTGLVRRDEHAALLVDVPGGEQWQRCPSCRKGFVHRSRARGRLERLRRLYGTRRLFRCDTCGWRGWLDLMDRGVSAETGEAPVDLEVLDRATGHRRRKKSVVLGDLD